MSHKIEITFDVIIHATEDAGRLYGSFESIFDMERDSFKIQKLEGHFENPIVSIEAKIAGGEALKIIQKILSVLSAREKNEILETIHERMDESSLYLRLDKQEFVRGRISLGEKNAVKIRIHKPVYIKNNIIQEYRDLLNFG